MAYDLTAMRAEVVARGFDYLSNTRIDRFINDAIHTIDDIEEWSFLRSSTTGASPLTIADLGRIKSVSDVANLNPINFLDEADIVGQQADLTRTGPYPLWYYMTSATTITTYPVTTVTLTVKYYKVSPDLTAGADVPLMPDRYRYAIVDYAVAKALEDVSNYAEAAAARQSGDATISRMREWDLLQPGGPNQQIITYSGTDW